MPFPHAQGRYGPAVGHQAQSHLPFPPQGSDKSWDWAFDCKSSALRSSSAPRAHSQDHSQPVTMPSPQQGLCRVSLSRPRASALGCQEDWLLRSGARQGVVSRQAREWERRGGGGHFQTEGWAVGSKDKPHQGLALISLPGPTLSSMPFRNDSPADKILAGPGGPGEPGDPGRGLDPTPLDLSAPMSKRGPRPKQTHRCRVLEPSLRAPTLPPLCSPQEERWGRCGP